MKVGIMKTNNRIVLITGASGFIGLNTVKLFAQKNYKIYAIVRNNIAKELLELREKYDLQLIKCDLGNKEEVINMYEQLEEKPSTIVHIAGLASDIGADSLFRKSNYDSTINLAELNCDKFIYISSTDVYGIKDFHREKEEELPLLLYPNNPYPKYKIECEKWLKNNLPKDKYVIIRPADVFGENDKTLEKRFVDFLQNSPFIVYFGKWKGKNRYPLASVDNVSKTIFAVTEYDEWNGEAINIIDEKFITIENYYEYVAKKYFPEKKFRILCLPIWFGRILGFISTSLSNLMKKKHPVFDPSYYASYHISSNLDFSGEKMNSILKTVYKEEKTITTI